MSENDNMKLQFEDGAEYGKKQSKSLHIAVAVVIAFVLALGVGIGVGFAIGNNEAGDKEPIVDPTSSDIPPTEPTPSQAPGPPPPWNDVPCFQGDQPKCPKGVSSPPLILISLDGFRANFMKRGLNPILKRLSECGVSTPYMIPSFPTVTFPNHYTIVTGLYPESHGLIDNSMYDPVLREQFCLSCDEAMNNHWWGGEPIWNTVVKQGKRSASYFWTGSDVDIQDMRPTYYFLYDGDNSYEQRVDVLRGWLSLPDDRRPDFITMYLDEPDHTGHDPGPDSDEENEVLKHVDEIIERLMDSIVELGMENCVNIMVIADHGMANRTCDQVYILDDYINKDDYYTRNTAGTMLRIDPKSSAVIGDPKEIVAALKCKHPVAVPAIKQDVPKRWHYINNRRIEDTVVPVEAGWTANDGPTTWCDGGTHGYDNLSPYMQALFIAYGPAFKQNLQVEPFQNIELYNLMCEILGIDPAPNNGTAGSLHHLLNHPNPLPPTPAPVGTPDDCPYPSTDEEYYDRIDNDMSQCICILGDETTKTIKDFDEQLDLSDTDEMAAKETHAPFGLPEVDFESSYCDLIQSNYITGFSHDVNMPLFVSYTMEKRNRGSPVAVSNCTIRPDVRIDTDMSSNCTDYGFLSGELENVTMSYLYSPDATDNIEDSMNARITSNMVPQYPGFVEDLWEFVRVHLLLWSAEYNGINVVAGPIFDFDFDGLQDHINVTDKDGTKFGNTLFPTHYFVVITRCTSGQEMNKNCNKLEPLTFILQNVDGIQTCQHPSVYMERNIATIQDVEMLTGLRLFPNLPQYDSIHLKHRIYSKGTLWQEWKYGL
ncbi:venom phosphodiesterase 2-like [Amphiura filiformis]|uniref:venom phosphodiesterase 2-like n=1 Tax=Amphiura filiformis TaxID=82378 RepID=UPI003B218988